MTGWRSNITKEFSKEIAASCPITLVADPDELLLEQEILEHLSESGFDLIVLEDRVRFRFIFETKYRGKLGFTARAVVVLMPESDPLSAPADILEEASSTSRILKFCIADIFPELDPQVISQITLDGFDQLYSAYHLQSPKAFGASQTNDFVLRHVFEIVPELVKSDVDFLRLLLQRHYRGVGLPRSMATFLTSKIQKRFTGWPIESLLLDRDQFFTFLNERWPKFVLSSLGKTDEAAALSEACAPKDIPFGHEDIRVYVDNLFLEGHLTPFDGVHADECGRCWFKVGVVAAESEDQVERLGRLAEKLNIPDATASRDNWLLFAQRLGECLALRWDLHTDPNASPTGAKIDEIVKEADANFSDWLLSHYGTLASLPYLPTPPMVHQVPQAIGHGRSNGDGKKVALVVVDGLALDQWSLLRDSLTSASDRRYNIDDRATFAWVPTLTSVSRQSIFAGEPPVYFADSITTTQKEPNLWKKFWEDRGYAKRAVGYLCYRSNEDDDDFNNRLNELASDPAIQISGVVIGFVDQSMHGVVNGSYGLHSAVKAWAATKSFKRSIDILLDNDFEIFVTADHGNVEARGIGKPNVGVTAEERGERVHIFFDEKLRTKTKNDFVGSIEWPSLGLPDDYFPLVAPAGKAFKSAGSVTVGHGGISLQEIVVPFVKIRRGE
jgi:hypothetical protein